jgi:hypothetical protein
MNEILHLNVSDSLIRKAEDNEPEEEEKYEEHFNFFTICN